MCEFLYFFGKFDMSCGTLTLISFGIVVLVLLAVGGTIAVFWPRTQVDDITGVGEDADGYDGDDSDEQDVDDDKGETVYPTIIHLYFANGKYLKIVSDYVDEWKFNVDEFYAEWLDSGLVQVYDGNGLLLETFDSDKQRITLGYTNVVKYAVED